MNKLTKWLHLRSAVKESFDNLPSGVCIFSGNGLVVLCNYQMSRLIFSMTGHDLQSLDELSMILNKPITEKGAVKDGSSFILPDGSVWDFSSRQVKDRVGNIYTNVTANDITDLRKKQKLLTEANEAKKQTISTLEKIQDNVVSITREEEILSMKMKLHHEFGYNLQTIRKFFKNGCPQEEKESFIIRQRNMIKKMQREIDNNDDIDPLTELENLAKALEMQIIFYGEKPKQKRVREILSYAVRECLTNTIRHAEGNQVFVELYFSNDALVATLTNAGKQPVSEIVEGGGLTSLRMRVEKSGGTMIVHGVPRFSMTVTIPMQSENENI